MRVTRSVIPNLFTITNLFCGFSSMVHTLNHDYKMAAVMIVIGGIFDALDGVMARLTRSSSEFGVELDSLADIVSFGVAPSLLVYSAAGASINPPGMLLSALPAICGALRLARFNVQLVGFDKSYFRGLPIPAAAFLIVSYVYFYFNAESSSVLVNSTGLMGVTIAVSLLMVSTVKYDTIPKFSRKALAEHPVKFTVFVAGITVAVATLGQALFPLMALYIVAGVVRGAFTFLRRRSAEPEESLDDEERAQEIVS